MVITQGEGSGNIISICLKRSQVIKSTIPKISIAIEDHERLINSNETLTEVLLLFNTVTDGRAFSIAAKTKEVNPHIKLHAGGAINEELCYFLKRSGFDIAHFERDENKFFLYQNPFELYNLINPFKSHYQFGNDKSQGKY
jgi:uncharacterized protein (DUF934 family)